MSIDLGSKVKEARKTKKLSISVLSKKCDVSEGMISQIETMLFRLQLCFGELQWH